MICVCGVSGCLWCSRFQTATCWCWWCRPTATAPNSSHPSPWSPRRSNISFDKLLEEVETRLSCTPFFLFFSFFWWHPCRYWLHWGLFFSFPPACFIIMFINGRFCKDQFKKWPWPVVHITPQSSATGWDRRRSAGGLSPVMPTTLRSARQQSSHCVVKIINCHSLSEFISPLQENANDCGGASAISLSASLFLACLSFSVSWWWTTLLLQPFSHSDGKDNGSADVFG